jgi:hypothetical protein
VIEKMRDTWPTASVALPNIDENPAPEAVPLLKLHGSVDWVLSHSGQVSYGSYEAALEQPNDRVVIGCPGPLKATLATGLLRTLWDRAEEALRAANRICFIGYRFPESDADSRRRLLSAVRENTTQHLVVETVLGWDTNSASSRRLGHLLRTCLGHRAFNREPLNQRETYYLVEHPLFAEDFMALGL